MKALGSESKCCQTAALNQRVVLRFTKIKNLFAFFLFYSIFNRMVEYGSRLLDRTFGALADPTRRRILAQLAKGEECVTHLARPHSISLAAVSKHLIVLEKAGLVTRRRDGRVHSLTLEAKPMQEAQAWLDRYRKFWVGNLDQFEKYLDKLQNQENKHDKDKK
jgi:DNA-binding transcriptional ArsR family regulator